VGTLALVATLSLAGCYTLMGGAVGAGGGALVGSPVDAPGAGAVIGGIVGAGAGYLIGNEMQEQDYRHR
jgi:surface antigen